MGGGERRPLSGKGGWQGQVMTEPVMQAGVPHVRIDLDGSNPILVPRDMLHDQRDGSFYLPLTREQLLQGSQPAAETGIPAAPARDDRDALVIPVVEEVVDVRKRQWETGGVRVEIGVREREEVVDEPLVREEVRVERVPVNQVVAEPPGVRQEGDTMIVPVLEEVLVIEKRLVLKEEVRITRRRFEAHEPQRVQLRTEEPRIERMRPDERSGSEREAA